jgi:segregation and condensation protein B
LHNEKGILMSPEQLQNILEAAIMAAGRPLTVNDMLKLFDESEQINAQAIRNALEMLQQHYATQGIELRELASGYQFQAKTEYSPWLSKLWEERPPKYSRAVLETIALIAYRQPITRAEIEEIRGVTVSSNIIKTLQEREWIKVVGYRDVPGKPALYGTTKVFLDHLSLKSLNDLPALSELIDLESQEEKLQVQLELAAPTDTNNKVNADQQSVYSSENMHTDESQETLQEIDSEQDTECVDDESSVTATDEIDSDLELDTYESSEIDVESLDYNEDETELTDDVDDETSSLDSEDEESKPRSQEFSEAE